MEVLALHQVEDRAFPMGADGHQEPIEQFDLPAPGEDLEQLRSERRETATGSRGLGLRHADDDHVDQFALEAPDGGVDRRLDHVSHFRVAAHPAASDSGRGRRGLRSLGNALGDGLVSCSGRIESASYHAAPVGPALRHRPGKTQSLGPGPGLRLPSREAPAGGAR